MSKRLSFYIFFLLSFCAIVFFLHARRVVPARVLYYYVCTFHISIRPSWCVCGAPATRLFSDFSFLCAPRFYFVSHIYAETDTHTHTHWYTVTHVYISIVHAPREPTSRIHLIMPIAREYCSRRVRLFVDHYYSPGYNIILLYFAYYPNVCI